MGALVGGIIALVLGIILLILWFGLFIKALMAIVPIGLILGGALATYLGIEEWKDAQERAKSEAGSAPAVSPAQAEDAEKYKAEAEQYKAELEALKKGERED